MYKNFKKSRYTPNYKNGLGSKQGSTFYCKGSRMWKYPSNSTMEKLKKQGITCMVWQNGDFITF